MKLNKILSSALVMVMLVSSIMAVIPISASAASSDKVVVKMGQVDETVNVPENLLNLVAECTKYNYATAADMLAAELKKGVLDSVSAGGYNLYVNRYTGFVFYENTRTGQILTSNPTDPGTSNGNLDYSVLSQIELEYKDVSDASSETGGSYNSLGQLEQGFAISLSPIEEQEDGRAGISVQYSLGVNSIDFRVPKYITDDDFKNNIANPIFKKIAETMVKYCGESSTTDYDLSDNDDIFYKGYYNAGAIRTKLTALTRYANSHASSAEGKALISKYIKAANNVFDSFSYINANNISAENSILLVEAPVLKEGVNLYTIKNINLNTYRIANNALIDVLADDYTPDDARADLQATGCLKNEDINSASFKISINYTLSPDGELYYEVPMSAPYFINNNPNYSIKTLTPLKYFGAGDINKDGYIFFPDGSGTVVNFDNINTIQANYISAVYGNDYGYSSLDPTRAHLEQVTMPVYGMVNEVSANAVTKEHINEETITNGFFAIVEEGATLMNFTFSTISSQHKYASVASQYQPHPMDRRDLSETLSAGVSGKYYIVSESKYEGNYKTKIVMLTDEKLSYLEKTSYEPTYVGMANCYRDYLINSGVMGQISEAESKTELPIYIEVLGAMDVTQKVLSFPVVMSTPLTTFDNVETIYSELSEAGVNNINFRLTGFANGGMASTYPVKVKWQNSLGGKKELASLLDYADDINAKNDGSNIGIYPDFDFLYIHNTAMFDGVGYRGTAAIMVDNRYASKQIFNSALQLYESMFAIVVSPDVYGELYNKFEKAYSKYELTNLSVATLGKELNSNFDKDNSINREDALSYTKSLLSKMADKYSLMTDVGNVYSMKYVDHILNAPTDSSHYKYSSYTVPFYGMVFHSYVSYAGSPINYSGSPSYEILRAIESGASLQYILCYDNTNYLKADPNLSKYYGVDYKNWKNLIVDQYNRLKTAIGDVSNNVITNHTTLIAERVQESSEMYSNYATLLNEFIMNAEAQFEAEITKVAEELRENGAFAGKSGLYANVDTASVIVEMLKALNLTENQAKGYTLNASELKSFGIEAESDTLYNVLSAKADDIADKFAAAYPNSANPYEINLSAEIVEYRSKYNFETTSYATDDDYASTSYTCDNYNVVMVTYTDPETKKQTIFFINFNVYDVKVKIDSEIYPGIKDLLDEKGYFTVKSNDYVKIK